VQNNSNYIEIHQQISMFLSRSLKM